MKKSVLIGVVIAAALASALFGAGVWQDTHPAYETKTHTLKAGYTVELPAAWPKPSEEEEFVGIDSAYDGREGSLEQFKQGMSIHDYGMKGDVDAVLKEMVGEKPTARVSEVVLANGIVAKTWTAWVPWGELSQEHRGYVFKAPNGHVYSGWQPLPRNWRMKRRYDNIFRAALGSIKFKS